MKLLIINGPNINLLGIREKDLYGTESYSDLCSLIENEAKNTSVEIEIFQSNSEGEIITCIQNAYEKFDGIIINPGAYTHYSYAIYDALKSVSIPSIEVHITNIHAREEFRRKSVTAAASIGIISGFGTYGYILALNYFKNKIS